MSHDEDLAWFAIWLAVGAVVALAAGRERAAMALIAIASTVIVVSLLKGFR